MSTMMSRLACAAVLATLTSLATAQSCPATVQVRSEPQAAHGWAAVPALSVHPLAGVSIVDGPLNDDRSREFDLAPQQMPNGTQLWKFRGPLEANQVWMRCWFVGTEVQLTRAVNAQVTECEQRIVRDPKTRKVLNATAVCR